jgi:hypothetical protein
VEITTARIARSQGDVAAELFTEEGITVGTQNRVFNSKKELGQASLVVFGSRSAADKADLKWTEHIPSPLAFVLTPRGVEEPWTKKSPPNYVERAHALLGRTVDQGRVFDVISWMRRQVPAQTSEGKKVPVALYGHGQTGIIAAYAALLQPGLVDEVVIVDPPASHKDGPYFLNVLRVLDIPEALGLLAPNVRLTLINARDPAFDRTAEIYQLAGAADKLTRK